MKATTRPFLRIRAVAAELGCTRAHAYRLVALGRIPAVHRGRSVLIPTAAWQAWLANQTEVALAALRDAPAPMLNDGSTLETRDTCG